MNFDLKYQKEGIPDSDKIFRAIHKMWIENGEIKSIKAFTYKEDGISAEWEKYATPRHTQEFHLVNPPGFYGVCCWKAGEVREAGLLVQHDPLPSEKQPRIDNQAHCLLTSLETSAEDIKEYQYRLKRACKLIVQPDAL